MAGETSMAATTALRLGRQHEHEPKCCQNQGRCRGFHGWIPAWHPTISQTMPVGEQQLSRRPGA